MIEGLTYNMFIQENIPHYLSHVLKEEELREKESREKESREKESRKEELRKEELRKESREKESRDKKLKEKRATTHNEGTKAMNTNISKAIDTIKAIETFSPNQTDSLFWCFYVLKYGHVKYEMECFNNYFVVEKQEKYNYISLLREPQHKINLKKHGIKSRLEVESNLVNDSKITMQTFFALCILENMNVILVNVHKRKLFQLVSNSCSSSSSSSCSSDKEGGQVHVVTVHKNQYSIDYKTSFEQYTQSFYIVPSLEDKLKGIGSYKVDELIYMCEKMGLQVQKTDKKSLYQLIADHY